MILFEILSIFFIYYFCKFIAEFLGFYIPVGVFSIILILLLVYLRLFKIRFIEKGSKFLLENLLVFFIPAVVVVYYDYGKIMNYGYGLLVTIFLSTALVFTGTIFMLKICMWGLHKWKK